MSRSQRVKFQDVRVVNRLVAQCGEVGDDATAWREHMVRHATRLLGCAVGLSGEVSDEDVDRPPTVEVGWESDAHAEVFHGHWRSGEVYQSAWFRGFRRHVFPSGTASTSRLYREGEWERAPEVINRLKPAGVGHHVVSLRILNRFDRLSDTFFFARRWGGRPFTPREESVAALLHDRLAACIGRELAATVEPSGGQLPPRRRQVLALALDGLSDKQIAANLGLSPFTVNDHMREIYRHFAVDGRTELLAYYLHRRRRARSARDDER